MTELSDKEVGELWCKAIKLQNNIKSWGYAYGHEGPQTVLNLIRKLVEERTEKLIYLCLGTNTISTCARLRHDHNIEARRDFGIPEEGWK